MKKTTLDRLDSGSMIDPVTDCWVWVKAVDSKGYGRISLGGKILYVHRARWEAMRGPLPEGKSIRHTCKNRACNNPAHLVCD